MEQRSTHPSEFPPPLLLNEAVDSADAALCAAAILAHPLVLLTPQSTVNRVHEVAVRGKPSATTEEWHLLGELLSTFADAERSLP